MAGLAGYSPPNLAIGTLYWKGWLMLLMIIAHNPANLGSEAWDVYPTLRALMEMCITNDFATSSGSTDQQELQVSAIEKQTILEFETHLAAASTKTVITENNSLLLSQVRYHSIFNQFKKIFKFVLEIFLETFF